MGKKLSFCVMTATVFGIGMAPVAPGTVATLAAGIPCFLAVGHSSWVLQVILAGLLTAIGCRVSTIAEWELERTDPSEVVIDEVCGFLIAMIGHPVTFASIITGFALFRLFDIWKPWPLRILQDRLKGGLGVMMDDVGAGIYANIGGMLILDLLGRI